MVRVRVSIRVRIRVIFMVRIMVSVVFSVRVRLESGVWCRVRDLNLSLQRFNERLDFNVAYKKRTFLVVLKSI